MKVKWWRGSKVWNVPIRRSSNPSIMAFLLSLHAFLSPCVDRCCELQGSSSADSFMTSRSASLSDGL